MPQLQPVQAAPSVFNYQGEPKVVTDTPSEVAKALIVWFEAPHALVIEDVCNLHDWFHMSIDTIRWGANQ